MFSFRDRILSLSEGVNTLIVDFHYTLHKLRGERHHVASPIPDVLHLTWAYAGERVKLESSGGSSGFLNLAVLLYKILSGCSLSDTGRHLKGRHANKR